MRILVLFTLLAGLAGCDYSAVETSLCGNKLSDVKGFVGKYQWNLGDGQKLPIRVVRVKRGVYGLSSAHSNKLLEYKTCKIGRSYIAEQLVASEEGNFYQVLDLKITRSSTILKSFTFEPEDLTDAGISFEYAEDDIEGEKVSVMVIDNSNISARGLLNLKSNTTSRNPFFIQLDR